MLSSRSFQQHRRHIPIPPKFPATIEFNFQWRNHSIFKNFYTTSPNAIKPSHAPFLLKNFPKRRRMPSEASRFVGSHRYKTNKLPCFIDMWITKQNFKCMHFIIHFNLSLSLLLFSFLICTDILPLTSRGYLCNLPFRIWRGWFKSLFCNVLSHLSYHHEAAGGGIQLNPHFAHNSSSWSSCYHNPLWPWLA